MVTLSDLNSMPLLDSAISETLRLASGSLIMREAIEPCTVTLSSGETYHIRKGDNVGIFPPLVHRDERFYSQPNIFQYNRFLTQSNTITIGKNEILSSQCLLPFGGGISYCPGRKFARNEIKVLAIHLLLNYHMSLDESQQRVREVIMDYSRAGLGVFQPKDCKIKLKLSPRRE